MWSPPPPLSLSWRPWILLHIWMKEMFAWSRAKHQDPSASASWTWTPTRYQNTFYLGIVFNSQSFCGVSAWNLFFFLAASEAFGWAPHQTQPALCWWSQSICWNCKTTQEPKVSWCFRVLLPATVPLEVILTISLIMLSVRRDLDKPSTSILGIPPEGSVIGVSSRNSLFWFKIRFFLQRFYLIFSWWHFSHNNTSSFHSSCSHHWTSDLGCQVSNQSFISASCLSLLTSTCAFTWFCHQVVWWLAVQILFCQQT